MLSAAFGSSNLSHVNARQPGHFSLGVSALSKAIIYCQRSARFRRVKPCIVTPLPATCTVLHPITVNFLR